jgi:hypothetical protein
MNDFDTPVRVLDQGDGIILLLADRGEIIAGRRGKVGRLPLRNEDDAGVIGLNAATGQISIGGNGLRGKIRTMGANGASTIFLDGNTGEISLFVADCAEEFDVSGDDPVDLGPSW